MRDYHIKDPQVRQAEIIPVDEKRLFVDEYGKKIEEGAIRFGMKDAGGRIHYFCIRRLDQIPEYEADEIYPADEFSKAEKERTAFCFRSFGYSRQSPCLFFFLTSDTFMRSIEMTLNTIHHIAIICSDKDEALHFYHDLLGFPIIRSNYREGRQDWKIDLAINDTTELELFIMKDRPARVSNPEAYGLRHLAFAVSSVEETVHELENAGIPCEPVRLDAYTEKPMTFFKDPDGLPIEIHE